MKNIKLLLCAIVALAVMSCEDSSTKALKSHMGKPYELLVIAPKALWDSQVGDTVKAIFSKPVEMLNVPEPLYDVIQIEQDQMNEFLQRHRNILKLVVDDQKYTKTDMVAQMSAKVDGQTVIAITSPSQDSLSNYIWENRKTILGMYDKSERERFMQKASKIKSDEIAAVLERKFGYTMDIPNVYKIRNEKDDFLWISYPLKLGDIGFTFYTYVPKADTVNLIMARDEAVKNIPGPSEGSYMTTEKMFMPMFNSVKINDREWVEMRGFWKVQNDFMGGPFVNYTTTDPVTGKVIGIDCYVQLSDPKESMRNYLRQLEALVATLKFQPTQKQDK